MDELINYNGYEEFKQAVNRVLNRNEKHEKKSETKLGK